MLRPVLFNDPSRLPELEGGHLDCHSQRYCAQLLPPPRWLPRLPRLPRLNMGQQCTQLAVASVQRCEHMCLRRQVCADSEQGHRRCGCCSTSPAPASCPAGPWEALQSYSKSWWVSDARRPPHGQAGGVPCPLWGAKERQGRAPSLASRTAGHTCLLAWLHAYESNIKALHAMTKRRAVSAGWSNAAAA